MPKEISESDYGHSLEIIKREYKKEEEFAMEVDDLSREIYQLFEANKTKNHYVFRNDKFKKWIIPRYIIPDRVLDRLMKKN